MPENKKKCKNILYLGLDPARYLYKGVLTHLPLIQIQPFPFEGTIKEFFEKLEEYTHILFTSRSAIPIYINYALKAGFPYLAIREKIYICLGKATSLGLEECGLKASHIAQEETGEGVVSLLETLSLDKANLFFPHSAKARSVIQDYLKVKKISHRALTLYDTLPNKVTFPDLKDFDEIVFTSPSTVHAFFTLFKGILPKEKCIPIGPVTKQVLKKYFLI